MKKLENKKLEALRKRMFSYEDNMFKNVYTKDVEELYAIYTNKYGLKVERKSKGVHLSTNIITLVLKGKLDEIQRFKSEFTGVLKLLSLARSPIPNPERNTEGNRGFIKWIFGIK